MLDKLAGAQQSGDVQFAIRFNDDYSHKNEYGVFEDDNNSLAGLQRIVVITTQNTASASELVINALEPYMEVVTVGERTYGKPVGMEGKIHDGKIYFLINFEIVNSVGVGGYYEGIAVDCAAEDDLSHALGDPREASLAAAMYYIETSSCL